MTPQRKSVSFETTINDSTAIILLLLIVISYNINLIGGARYLPGEFKSPPFATKESISHPEAKGNAKAIGGNPSTYHPPATPGVPPSSPPVANAPNLAGELKNPPFATKVSISYPEDQGNVKAPGRNPSTYLPPPTPGSHPSSPPIATAPDLVGEPKNPPFPTKMSISYPEAKGDVKAPGRNPSTYLPPATHGSHPSSPPIATAMDLAGELKNPPFATKVSISHPEAKGNVEAPGRNPSTYLPPATPGSHTSNPPIATAMDLAGELKNPPFATKVSISYPEAKGNVKAPGRNPSTYLPPATPGSHPSSPPIATATDLAGELKNPPFATKVSISYPEAKGNVKAPGRNPSTYLPPATPGSPPSR